MITKQMATLIYNLHSNIENAEGMIKELQDAISKRGEVELKDYWGERCGLELRIPSPNGSSWNIKRIPAELTLEIIEKQIDNDKKELDKLMGICKIQLA